jgi:hypothetical protein
MIEPGKHGERVVSCQLQVASWRGKDISTFSSIAAYSMRFLNEGLSAIPHGGH